MSILCMFIPYLYSFQEIVHSVLHMPNNATRSFSEFLLSLSHSFNFHSLVSPLVSNACKKMLIHGAAKQKKPGRITLISIKMDLLLCVFVSWNGDALWKIQDESTVVLDKCGLGSLLSNTRIPSIIRETQII